MQRINDADHIATYSDSTYPVGPDTSGEITYVHVPPLGPLSSACDLFVGIDTLPNVCAPRPVTVIALSCLAVAAFIWCYLYPLVQKWSRAATGKTAEGRVKQQQPVSALAASARSLFSLRSQRTTTSAPHWQPLGAQRYGELDMRIAKPPPVARLSHGSSFLPSLSSTSESSSSPSSSPPLETPLMYALPSAGRVPRVIVAPVDVGILGQTVGCRTTPKKAGDDFYDGRRADDNE